MKCRGRHAQLDTSRRYVGGGDGPQTGEINQQTAELLKEDGRESCPGSLFSSWQTGDDGTETCLKARYPRHRQCRIRLQAREQSEVGSTEKPKEYKQRQRQMGGWAKWCGGLSEPTVNVREATRRMSIKSLG